MSQGLIKAWYQGAWWLWLLWPLSIIYRVLRRLSLGLAATPAANHLPLLVVGNISVGGTGKTPLVQALVHDLSARGIRCGIISRGYGGSIGKGPYLVGPTDIASKVGDEPLLLWRTTGVPVAVGSNRQADIKCLTSKYALDLIISDDGLQNHTIKGDCEWLLIDGQRGLGNRQCLPMGPLREPASRLHTVDAVFITGSSASRGCNLPPRAVPTYEIKPKLVSLKRLCDDEPVAWPVSGTAVKALAGIGNPERFFNDLQAMGLQVEGSGFKDHHDFVSEDLVPFLDVILIMTAKDAVKCKAIAASQNQPRNQHWYYAEQGLDIPEPALAALLNKLHLDANKDHHG
ncbi:MAG TPA: tetraacyldisaccharide 4'-kinase [Oceanospirillaceae bacterium]|nr:tetraacyldisaccharide 4'-kinase [Oceanospirillaceae bacterium]